MELLMVGGVAGLEGSSWSFEAPVGRSISRCNCLYMTRSPDRVALLMIPLVSSNGEYLR